MMIKNIWLVILIVVFSGCNRNTLTNDFSTSQDLLKKDKIDKKDKTKKKGIGTNYKTENWSSKVSALNVEWHYSWGYYLTPKEPDNVQYVPMDWGGSIKNDALIDYLVQKKNTGEFRYVLGFNEPDNKGQSNMTVDEALNLWPRLEQVGLPLGSPATVNPEGEWMQTFMSEAKARGLRIDFVCVHSYGGINAQAFYDKLKRVYDLYQKPIWITEFAVADWGATSPVDNKYSPDQVLSFMETVLPALDTLKYIERYAWFSADQSNNALTSSALFDDAGNLTPLGEYYAHHKQNSLIGNGKDDYVLQGVPGNLISNGNFECGDNSYWGGYNSKTTGVVTTAPHSGDFLGQINAKDGSFVYYTTLEPDSTYEISLWSKWASTPPGDVNVVIRDSVTNNLIYKKPISSSTDWTQTIGEFKCPSGTENIKVVVYKPAKQNALVTSELYLDDFVLRKMN